MRHRTNQIPLLLWLGSAVCLTAGACINTLHGNGEVGFRTSSSYAFYHETEKADETQTSTYDLRLPTIESYLFECPADPDANTNGAE